MLKLYSAILSPAVRVHDFGITDIQNFAVRIAWDIDSPQRSEMEVFKANHELPFCRMITLARREPLTLQLFYADPHLRSDSFIGMYYNHRIISYLKESAKFCFCVLKKKRCENQSFNIFY